MHFWPHKINWFKSIINMNGIEMCRRDGKKHLKYKNKSKILIDSIFTVFIFHFSRNEFDAFFWSNRNYLFSFFFFNSLHKSVFCDAANWNAINQIRNWNWLKMCEQVLACDRRTRDKMHHWSEHHSTVTNYLKMFQSRAVKRTIFGLKTWLCASDK